MKRMRINSMIISFLIISIFCHAQKDEIDKASFVVCIRIMYRQKTENMWLLWIHFIVSLKSEILSKNMENCPRILLKRNIFRVR